MHCKTHGPNQKVYVCKDKTRKTGKRVVCAACAKEAVTRRIQKVKALLVEEAGGKCVLCGYCTSMRSLHFHHKDKTTKVFNISGGSKSLHRLRVEISKCVLVCSNCHGELEEGIKNLSGIDV